MRKRTIDSSHHDSIACHVVKGDKILLSLGIEIIGVDQTYAPNKTQRFKSGFGFSIC